MQPFSYQHKCLLLNNSAADLIELSLRRGATRQRLLAGTGIFPDDFRKTNRHISPQEWLTLAENCLQQVGRDELPMLAASAVLYNNKIALSRLLQCCPSLKQALQLLYYFRQQSLPLLSVSLCRQQDYLNICLLPAIGLGKQQDFVIALAVSFLLTLIRQYAPDSALRIELTQPSPARPQYYQQHWQCETCFNSLQNRLILPLNILQPAVANTPAAEFIQARFICRQQRRLQSKSRGLLEIIRKKQQQLLPDNSSPEQIAAMLNISSSTLKRQLSQHHYSFSQLLDEVKNQKAMKLLRQYQLTNAQLAQKLGYSDEHNFRRAFKRWTGLLPSTCKALLKI